MAWITILYTPYNNKILITIEAPCNNQIKIQRKYLQCLRTKFEICSMEKSLKGKPMIQLVFVGLAILNTND